MKTDKESLKSQILSVTKEHLGATDSELEDVFDCTVPVKQRKIYNKYYQYHIDKGRSEAEAERITKRFFEKCNNLG